MNTIALQIEDGFVAIRGRPYDEEQMGTVGEPFAIAFHTVTAMTVF